MRLKLAKQILLVATGSILTLYLSLITYAHPSPGLILALSVELGFFLSMLFFKKLNAKRKSEQKKALVIDVLIKTTKPISFLKTITDVFTVLILTILVSLFALDLSALCASVCGNFKLAKATYIISPFPMIDGCHPALSLEIYSGACIESGKFKDAHRYTEFLLDLRKSIYGENDWHYGGMLGNLAGLYYKEGNFKKAIETYEESIQVCKISEGDKHLGSAYTRLANSFRAIGKFDEARKNYEKALAMRINEYGANSLRVAETELELANLFSITNQNSQAEKYRLDAQKILNSRKNKKSGDPTSIIAMIAFSFAASIVLFGKRGFLTGLAIRRVEQRINQDTNSSQEDLIILNKLKT